MLSRARDANLPGTLHSNTEQGSRTKKMKDQLTALKTKYQRFYFRLCCDKYLPTLFHDYSNIVGSESFIWNVEMSLGHLSVPVLGAFACSREATATSVMSVRPHVSARLPLDGFP